MSEIDKDLCTFLGIAYDKQIVRDVGNFTRRAMLDVAGSDGTPQIVEEIKPLVLDKSEDFPLKAWTYVEEHYSGFKPLILDRAEEVQKQKQSEDRRRKLTLRKPRSSDELVIEQTNRSKLKTIFQRKRN